MRKRTKARECALQALYQADICHADAKSVLEGFWREHDAEVEVSTFANRLVAGTLTHQQSIDSVLQSHADNWDLKRMAVVDRNILRLGIYELMYETEVPPSVSINEAIELAKRFGDSESAKFINGILDAVHKNSKGILDRPPHPGSRPA